MVELRSVGRMREIALQVLATLATRGCVNWARSPRRLCHPNYSAIEIRDLQRIAARSRPDRLPAAIRELAVWRINLNP